MNKQPERLDNFEQGNNEHLPQLGWNGEINGKVISKAMDLCKERNFARKSAEGTAEEGFAQDKLEKAKFNALTVSGVTTGIAFNNRYLNSLPSKGWRDLAANDDFVSHVADSSFAEKVATGEIDVHGESVENTSYKMGENDHSRRYGLDGVVDAPNKLDQKYLVNGVDKKEDVDTSIPFTLEETSGYKIIKQGDQLKDSPTSVVTEPGQVVFANMADQLAKYGAKENPQVVQNPVTGDLLTEEAFQAKKALHERGLDLNLDVPELTVNTLTEEEQAAKKAEWMRNNPDEAAQDAIEKASNAARNEYRDQVAEEAFQAKKALHERGLDLNLDIPVTEENHIVKGEVRVLSLAEQMQKDAEDRVKKLIEESANRHLDEMSERKVESTKKTLTPEEYLALAEEGLKGCKEAMPKIEKVKEVLAARNEKAKEGLMAMGLGKLGKGLEAWKKVNPKYKIALAITLAGASVATGGLTSILSKGLSAVTFASDAFQKEVERKMKDNEKVNKGMIAAKSILKGIVLALGTSQLISIIGEGIGSAWNHMTPNHGVLPPGAAPIPDHVPAAPAMPVVPDLPTAYEVLPGDNLTKIFSTNVLDHLPGAEGLSHMQKENVIQNLLKLASENPGDKAFATINQFANPDLIHPGNHINLKEVGDAIRHSAIDDKLNTLITHARSLKI